MATDTVAVVGAGLAGCECALRLARSGVPVTLFEQKPAAMSPAHRSPDLAELVRSTSLCSHEPTSCAAMPARKECREIGVLLIKKMVAILDSRCRHMAHVVRRQGEGYIFFLFFMKMNFNL